MDSKDVSKKSLKFNTAASWGQLSGHKFLDKG